MEGIQAMCEDLGVQPDDIVVLVLRWVLRPRRCLLLRVLRVAVLAELC